MLTISPVRAKPAAEGSTRTQRSPPSIVWYSAPPEPPAQISAESDDTERARKIVRGTAGAALSADFSADFSPEGAADFAAGGALDLTFASASFFVPVFASAFVRATLAVFVSDQASTVTISDCERLTRLKLVELSAAIFTSSHVLPPSKERCNPPLELMVQRGGAAALFMSRESPRSTGAGGAEDACSKAGFALPTRPDGSF